jgi:hypothetical protein
LLRRKQERREKRGGVGAVTEVDDRCDVKKPAKERPIKTKGFTGKKRGRDGC